MNRREKSAGKVLDEFFGRVPKSSQRQMEEAEPRMWNRISLEAQSLPNEAEAEVVVRAQRRYWAVLAVAAALVVLVVGAGLYREAVNRRELAALTAVDVLEGHLYRLDGMRMLDLGTHIERDLTLHSGGRATDRAVFRIPDGSRVEVRPASELKIERADDGIRIRLNRGSVLVTAAKQRKGHLYVQTRDMTVAVVGTVFVVNAEEPGSRVSVIEGEVRVDQMGTVKTLLPGQQLVTNPLMSSPPVAEAVSWSPFAGAHVTLLQQSAPTAASAKPLEFEVFTFREGERTWPLTVIECRGIDGVWSLQSDLALNPLPAPAREPAVPLGRCVGAAVPRSYLGVAYEVKLNRISGDESAQWFYHLDAKAENPATATLAQLREMLRNLVIAEFKPKVYRETKDLKGYFLVVGKNGPKFKAGSTEETMSNPKAGPPNLQGVPGMILAGRYRMDRFANILSMSAGGPVLDKTALPETYDLSLTLYPVPPTSTAGGLRGGPNAAAPEFDPPLARALEEQLGLQLEPTKVPVDHLVVQQVEKPKEK